MNGRVGFVVVITIPGSTEPAILETICTVDVLIFQKSEQDLHNAHEVANSPHAGSIVCLAINVIKSNWGSN
jgi:hypothetical protein